VKRVDNGVYQAIEQAKAGKFKGGTDLVFNLKNGGMGVGKINPAVPSSFITLMNQYKAQIIAGKLKPPASL
jgi:basic membrane protein A